MKSCQIYVRRATCGLPEVAELLFPPPQANMINRDRCQDFVRCITVSREFSVFGPWSNQLSILQNMIMCYSDILRRLLDCHNVLTIKAVLPTQPAITFLLDVINERQVLKIYFYSKNLKYKTPKINDK